MTLLLTTEDILTSPDGFGVPATPVQRAVCRARDGLPLGELAQDPDVQWAFGGAEAIAQLPGERGVKPLEFWLIAAPRTAKTTIAVAAALADSQSVDVSGVGVGEIPRTSILSLKLDVADVPFRRALGCIEASPALRPLLESSDATSFRIRHPAGKLIEIAVTAGGRAAGGLAARWSAGVIPDEAPKMAGRDDAVTNLDDVLSVARERMLPGSQIMPIGSPWAPSGPCYDAVSEAFGKPSELRVIARMRGPAANPRHWTPERMRRLEQSDPITFRIVDECQFLDPESGLFSPIAVARQTRETPLELAYVPGRARYFAAVDVGKHRWTLVIVATPPRTSVLARDQHAPRLFRVALAKEFLGESPRIVWSDIARTCARYEVTRALVDQYAGAESKDIAKQHGLHLTVRDWSAQNRFDDFSAAADLVHSALLELPPHREFRRDLLATKKVTTRTGYTIDLPRTSDGRHADFAPALAAALHAARSPVHADAYSRARAQLERLQGTNSLGIAPENYDSRLYERAMDRRREEPTNQALHEHLSRRELRGT